MKQIIIALIILLLFSSLVVTSYAENGASDSIKETQNESPAFEKTILDVLTNRAQEQKLQDVFLSPENVTDDLIGYSLEGKPVLLFITNIMRDYDLDNPIKMMTEVWENGEFSAIALYVVETSIDNEGTIRLVYNPANPSFPLWDPDYAGITRKHEDVGMLTAQKATLNGSAEQMFLGELHKINNVIFIGDYAAPYFPCAVYFTDGGVFVRVCLGEPATYPEYTWHDFAEIYNAYTDYLKEISRDKNGNLLVYGDSINFLDFVDNVYPAI